MRWASGLGLPEAITGTGASARKMRGRKGRGDPAAGTGAMACDVNGFTRYVPCQGQGIAWVMSMW